MNWEKFQKTIRSAVAGSRIVANLIEAVLANDYKAIEIIIDRSAGKYEDIDDFIDVIREAAIPYTTRRGLWSLIDQYRFHSRIEVDDITLRRAYNLYKAGMADKSPQIQLLESWIRSS